MLTDNPREVGADRVVNTLAAFTRFGGPAIVVDFGTGTNFDVVSERGEFLGGVIAPGLQISAATLVRRAARLTRVELEAPPSVIGKNTVEAIQSGLVFGTAGEVDGIVERIRRDVSGATDDRHRWTRSGRDPPLPDDRSSRAVPDARGPAARPREERG